MKILQTLLGWKVCDKKNNRDTTHKEYLDYFSIPESCLPSHLGGKERFFLKEERKKFKRARSAGKKRDRLAAEQQDTSNKKTKTTKHAIVK